MEKILSLTGADVLVHQANEFNVNEGLGRIFVREVNRPSSAGVITGSQRYDSGEMTGSQCENE